MSIVDILTEPTSKKRKRTFGDDDSKHEGNADDLQPSDTKRSKPNGHANKPAKNQSTIKFHQRLQRLIELPLDKKTNFKSIGVCRELCIATKKMKWTQPTKIQIECIPHILLGRDVIALAETGSGKTGAFCLPILQHLLSTPCSYHSLILSPTRELALQIHEQYEELGSDIGLKSITIIGGVDRVQQALKLQKKPHIIIGTPGRILDHLITCKGFKLFHLKFLVLDEADRILQSEFSAAIEQIIKFIQKHKSEHRLRTSTDDASKTNAADNANAVVQDYQTLLFSATMTKKVERLEKASLRAHDMIKLEVSNKYQTVSTLAQFYLFIPAKFKLLYAVYLLSQVLCDRSVIVFTNTKKSCHHLSLVLHNLSLYVIPLHGEMTQYERMGAVEKFKEGTKSILVATDVAARGLDIPSVTVIVNYDIPIHSKDYIHRVGRTARAGKKGQALNLVTQYDVEIFQRIEQLINLKMRQYPNVDKNDVMQLIERVMKADRVALMQIKDHKDEIKDRIKELSQRKRDKHGAPRLQVKQGEEGSDDDDDAFVIDDVDHEADEAYGQRSLGPRQKKSSHQIRNDLKRTAEDVVVVVVEDEDEDAEEEEEEGVVVAVVLAEDEDAVERNHLIA
eukprot:CAMPEP_0202706034 /NCGR_PEP_ID=MMETSP1385-20130828/18513_1 /ASSEMBLY_ACC=CAM_ASM_000861 /TAXON_ID=933848 /ORGANISM="Elphidium margaritaceum" /LENGTH=620 /DNA_ID=CAMNT_0049364407 /DNA_START=21 /DNA_END=1884 /DNA_ORIENTATION=-